jgi:hypothetical protein
MKSNKCLYVWKRVRVFVRGTLLIVANAQQQMNGREKLRLSKMEGKQYRWMDTRGTSLCEVSVRRVCRRWTREWVYPGPHGGSEGGWSASG